MIKQMRITSDMPCAKTHVAAAVGAVAAAVGTLESTTNASVVGTILFQY